MHVFYTEGGLTVHHHSSRGRGNPKSFLSDAFHHNEKKSPREREKERESAKCTGTSGEGGGGERNHYSSVLMIYSLQSLSEGGS